MALFEDDKAVIKVPPPQALFSAIYKPGEQAPYSGIYRCEGCGKEISHNPGTPLPPQNHHQHSDGQGDIRWKLLVFASTGK